MSEEWLIDGYNLLYTITPKNQKKSKISKEAVFGLLADFASAGDRRVLMVLDGKGGDEEFQAFKTKSFGVVYSQSVSADSYIEKYLYENKGRGMKMVVTRDRAVAQIARGTGARVMEPGEFLELLESGRKDAADILFKHKAKAHGFNRPFGDKLKDNP